MAVTREQAEAVLAAVRATHPAYLTDTRSPELIENWDWLESAPTRWAIVWEEGPDDWSIRFDLDDAKARVNGIHAANLDGIWIEPVTYWSISVCPLHYLNQADA